MHRDDRLLFLCNNDGFTKHNDMYRDVLLMFSALDWATTHLKAHRKDSLNVSSRLPKSAFESRRRQLCPIFDAITPLKSA